MANQIVMLVQYSFKELRHLINIWMNNDKDEWHSRMLLSEANIKDGRLWQVKLP